MQLRKFASLQTLCINMMKRTDKMKMNRKCASQNIREHYTKEHQEKATATKRDRIIRVVEKTARTKSLYQGNKFAAIPIQTLLALNQPGACIHSRLEGNRMLAILENTNATRHWLEFMIIVTLAARQSTNLMNRSFLILCLVHTLLYTIRFCDNRHRNGQLTASWLLATCVFLQNLTLRLSFFRKRTQVGNAPVDLVGGHDAHLREARCQRWVRRNPAGLSPGW